MSAIQMRPTFLVETDLSGEDVMRRVRAVVDHSGGEYAGQFLDQHAMISINKSKRHFWSPWMHLEIQTTESTRQVFGRFSPHPSIWTAFVFSYLAIVVLVFFAMLFGVSQQLSGESPWAYLFIPVGAVAAALLWFASKAGQKLAQAEMIEMKSKFEGCIVE